MFDLGFCVPPIPENPKHLVILLHGYGSNGENIGIIADAWRSHLPDTVFYAPNAPTCHQDIRNGYQWFELEDWTPHVLQQVAYETYPKLLKRIQEVQAHFHIGWEKTILVGFSQGCMMALGVSLFAPKVCKGVIGYSGGIYYDTKQIQAKPTDLKIQLIHGMQDTVVPAEASQVACQTLKKFGFSCNVALENGIDHTISYEGLKKGLEFLQYILKE